MLNIKFPNNNVTVSIALFWFRGISLCYKLNLNCFDHVFPGHHVDMAEEHGALLVALEHRFYGDSINPDGLKTENLASLSSQQALVMASYLSVCVCVCTCMVKGVPSLVLSLISSNYLDVYLCASLLI